MSETQTLELSTTLTCVISFGLITFIVFTFHYLDKSFVSYLSYLVVAVEATVTAALINLNTYEFASSTPMFTDSEQVNYIIVIITVLLAIIFCLVIPFSTVLLNDSQSIITAFKITLEIAAFVVFLFIIIPLVINKELESGNGFSIDSIFAHLDETAYKNLNQLYLDNPNTIINWVITGTCAVFVSTTFFGRLISVYYGGYGTVSTGVEMIRGTIFNQRSPFIEREKQNLSDMLNAPQHQYTHFPEYTKLKLDIYKKKYDSLHTPKKISSFIFMIIRIIFGLIAIVSSLFYVICIAISLYGSIKYSQCGWRCGFIPQTTGRSLPIERMIILIEADGLFVIRFVCMLLLNFHCAFTVFLGSRQLFTCFPGITSYVLKPKKTLPGSVVLTVAFICLSSIGFLMQIITICPNILMYGSQYDSNGNHCTMESPEKDCIPTGISKMIFKIIATVPYVGLIIYLTNILYIFCTSLCVFNEIFLLTQTFLNKTEKLLKTN